MQYAVMSHDDATSALMKAVTHGASDYWIKPLHQNQFRILRKLVARKLRIENNPPRKDNSDFASFIVDATMSVPKKRSSNSKEFDFYESDDCYAPPAKEHRVVWSEELHQEFVNAVMQIGLDSMIISSFHMIIFFVGIPIHEYMSDIIVCHLKFSP